MQPAATVFDVARRRMGVRLLQVIAIAIGTAAWASAAIAAASAPLDSLQLFFEANRGQFAADVSYVARGPGYDVVIGDDGVRYELGRPGATRRVQMVLEGGRSPEAVVPSQPLAGTVSYYRGNDPADWITHARTWGRVTLEGVYPSVDLVHRAEGVRAEYDFVLAAGADPRTIVVSFDGADSVEISPQGALVLHLGDEVLTTAPPIAFQGAGAARRPIDVAFAALGEGRIGFSLGEYDRDETLVIDPVILEYSTSLGGSALDDPTGLQVGSDGSIFVSGRTLSADFQGGPGALLGMDDVFVSKLSPDGSQLLYTVFFGGNLSEFPLDLEVDAAGNAYVVTQTDSANLPIVGGFDATLGGARDYAVLKLDPAGALLYSTYYGGPAEDGAFDDGGIALAPSGDVYITGRTLSLPPNGIDLLNPYQTTCANQCAFVAGFDTTQTGVNSLVYGSYVGGDGDDGGQGIDVDSSGDLYVFGFTSSDNGLIDATQAFQPVTNDVNDQDNFLIRLDPTQVSAAQRVYSSYIGSPQGEAEPRGGLFVESSSAVYVTGATSGVADAASPYAAGFPVKNAVQPLPGGGEDGYLVKVDTTTTGAASLVLSTFLGGVGNDSGHDVLTDGFGAIHIAAGFGSTVAALPEFAGLGNVSLVQLDPTGQIVETAIPLPDVYRLALDSNDRLLVAGSTNVAFPQVGALPASPVGGFELFIARFESLEISGATLDVDVTSLVPGAGDDFAYMFTLTNNGDTNLTDFQLTGDFPVGLSTLLSSFCFTGPGTITCAPSDPGDFAGPSAIVPNERITLFGRASSGVTGSFDISSLTATTTPADPDVSDNTDGVDVTVTASAPATNALQIADFDAWGMTWDSGGFAVDTPQGVLATSNGVLDDTANFMLFDSAMPVYVRDVYTRGRIGVGFVERTSWTPSSGDGMSLLDIDGGSGTTDRVYASVQLVGRGPVARVQLRSGNAFSASVLVPGQETRVGLDASKAFVVSVDPGTQSASVSYGGELILSGNPFSTVLTGGADVGDIGDDMVISTGRGVVDLGGALFNDAPADADADGLPDDLEVTVCSDASDADTDDDGLADGVEDANANGVVDAGETDPCNADSDFDGVQDGTESGLVAGVADPDGAGGPLLGTDAGSFVPDADPLTTTNPVVDDSDLDGFVDGAEDLNGNGRVDAGESDPNDGGSIPTTPVPVAGPVGQIVLVALVSMFGSATIRRRCSGQGGGR